MSLARGWIIVSLRMVMSFEPTKDAVSEIVMLGAREVGGLGAAGAVDARLAVDIIGEVHS